MAKGTLKISGADAFLATDIATGAVDTAELAADAVDGTKIADNAVDSEHIAADSIDAEHYAAGSVDATAIANDAVDSQHYAADSIDAEHYAAGSVDATAIANDAVDSQHIAADSIDAEHYAPASVDTTAMAASVIEVKPHIIPGVLYPSYVDSGTSNKLLDGTTAHSGAFGTAQSDGRKYFYTNIKGSKPIKDPRIGAHFGSQRHLTTSLQILTQETTLHGHNVYSIDGREWMRIEGIRTRPSVSNDANGNGITCGSSGTVTDVKIEITGYFNKANIQGFTNSYAGRKFDSCIVNGTEVTTDTTLVTSQSSPLASRYVNSGSLIPIEMGTVTSPQITTIRLIADPDGESFITAIELIAHDTATTARKSFVNIPAQNVVSYGKKFSVGSDTLTNAVHKHYDPFNGFTNSSGTAAGLHSTYVDTATSIGLSTPIALHGAPWAISGTNNIRPYNGGRVVKWVDSSGTIKTSVNMMPPNAQNYRAYASAEITTPSATNVYLPAFSNDVGATDQSGSGYYHLDTSLSEVAREFNFREFGNGGANHNNSYRDLSSRNFESSDQNTSYVMDDGGTSFSGSAYVVGSGNYMDWDASDYWNLTFIGTGFGSKHYGPGGNNTTNNDFFQNLPYGSHHVRYQMHHQSPWPLTLTIDGVTISTNSAASHMSVTDWVIHQPKRPPIPEDAVVIADYMLMADFVAQPTTLVDTSVPKGCRGISGTRDVFYNGTYTGNTTLDVLYPWGYYGAKGPVDNGSAYMTANLPFFGTKAVPQVQSSSSNSWTFNFDGATGVAHTHLDNAAASQRDGVLLTPTATLGLTNVTTKVTDNLNFGGYYVASPIHTSSHYQDFETPFLKNLVGGDRNMEQTNLVVTPDGKTWDEVTRDTSYIGPNCIMTHTDTATSWGSYVILDEWRGGREGNAEVGSFYNKDFAIAYDRVICLVDGWYQLYVQDRCIAGGDLALELNGNVSTSIVQNSTSVISSFVSIHTMTANVELTRGDYVKVRGEFGNATAPYAYFMVTRLNK